MLISTKSHGEKIYHNENCTYAKRIKEKNIIHIKSVGEALHKGYRACNCCSFMGKKYRSEKAEIQRYAKKNGMEVWLYNDAVYIEDAVAAWKITRYSMTEKMCLLHSNSGNVRRLEKEKGKFLYNYHLQRDAKRGSILGYLMYIKAHDEWRMEKLTEYKSMPRRTKKQKSRYRKAMESSKKKAVGNVLNLIDRLQAEREYREAMAK